MSKYKINAQEHLIHPLRVHGLLADFELEDVWRLPIKLTSAQSLQLFVDQFQKSNARLSNQGMAGLLFKIRLFVGRMMGWDDGCEHSLPNSIRVRYAKEEKLGMNDLPDPGSGSFIPVYKLENEFLSEIENKTVHAALHLSRVPAGKASWAIHMAVYVKPKGWFGKLYMVLIKPFRLWIVYPTMMRIAKKNWENYLKNGG